MVDKKTELEYRKKFNEYKELMNSLYENSKADFQNILRYKFDIPKKLSGTIYNLIKLDNFDVFKTLMQEYDKEIEENKTFREQFETQRKEDEQRRFEERQEETRMRNNIAESTDKLSAILEKLNKLQRLLVDRLR